MSIRYERLFFVLAMLLSTTLRADNQLKPVVMHEVIAKAYSTAVYDVEVGGVIGRVVINLHRDVDKAIFLGMKLDYGSVGVINVPSRFLSCIPSPLIELSTFYFTELGSKEAIKNDWFSSIEIPFGPASQIDEESDYVKIKRFPVIEFEIGGGKTISRIKIKKNENEIRTLKEVNTECPQELIRWALE